MISFGAVPSVNSHFEDDSPLVGPYIDEVVYSRGGSILDVLAGDIDMHAGSVYPSYYDQIEADPDIAISPAMVHWFSLLSINCAKYPFNISGFRRAIAFAINKTKIIDGLVVGLGIEHDALVPPTNGWSAEDQFDWHYYTGQPDIGNQMLDDLGFAINVTSGFRLTPNGSAFEITLDFYCNSGSCQIIPNIILDELSQLHIDCHGQPVDTAVLDAMLDNHEDYDFAYYSVMLDDTSVEWLAYDYCSEYADTYGQNPSNFKNDTFDEWKDQLLYGTSYEDVLEASIKMQKILHYNVPAIVMLQGVRWSVYRTDRFTGHIDDLREFMAGQWTTRKIHKIDGSLGGTVTIGLPREPASFNIFLGDVEYSLPIVRNLWPSLYKYGPDRTPWPDLAESMVIETHSDNSAVPDGFTRFTIDIIKNATWSDGTPLTEEDVTFTYTYLIESGYYGNPAITQFGPLFAVYSPAPYRVIFEYETESYWHFSDFGFTYIIPEHIFNDVDGIGYDGWNTWNPVFNASEPHVTCGPFTFTDFDEGEYYKIEKNPLFHYAKVFSGPVTETTSTTTATSTSTTATSTTTSTGTDTTSESESNWILVTGFVVPFSSIIVIYILVQYMRKRRVVENT